MSSSSSAASICLLPSDSPIPPTTITTSHSYLTSPVDAKGNVPDVLRDEVFKRLRSKMENRSCIDCNARNPTWISLSYGVYLCLTCSGKHRRMGTHLSFVRSTEMDKFSPEQLLRMELGGNGKARLFFRDHGLLDGKHIEYQTSKVAVKYKQQLDKDVHGVLHKVPHHHSPTILHTPTTTPPATADQASPLISSSTPTAVPPTTAMLLGAAVDRFTVAKPTTTADSPAAVSLTNTSTPTSSTGSAAGTTSFGDGGHAGSAASSGAAVYVGGRSGGIKAKKLDVDFDFEEATQPTQTFFVPPPALQPSPFSSFTSSSFATSFNSSSSLCWSAGQQSKQQTSTIPTPVVPIKHHLTDSSLNRFEGAKAISSDQMFNKTDNQNLGDFSPGEVSTRFASNTAISSGALFGDGQQQKGGMNFEDSTAAKIENMKDSAREGMSALAAASSDAMSRLGNWMNS
eukprot:GHVS01055805.1.p1 GENE.GHVS01055805.1~~GHVS01055805.1.p1  ORF type:complete len:456 (+),score=113.24 GHVS01055805.1:389-1756(+)